MDEHINFMPKPSNREKILTEGLKVVHERGFAAASVRDIVQAAGVPQGSFTNHFASKEAFGLEIIDIYFTQDRALMRETLRNDALPPLKRLEAYIDANLNRPDNGNMRNGCLFGNFAAEASDSSGAFRKRLIEIFVELQNAVAYCLKAAVKSGDLPIDFACDDVAGLVVSSLQGAGLLAKAYRSPAPVERFKRILFSKILR
jgi:TetR/AcrR family transcriptional repressor of nem operon